MRKGLKKIFKMKSGLKYFSVTYMCIWQRAMNITIVKISKTTTILNNVSNCCHFYFGVLLKNGKIGPRVYNVLFGEKEPKLDMSQWSS